MGETRGTIDQRAEPRSTPVMRTAKLVCQSGEYVCIVRDVSSGGVGLRFFHASPPEERMILHLPTGMTFPVECVWRAKERAGFRFPDRIDLDAFLHQPPAAACPPLTISLDTACFLHMGDDTHAGRLASLSTGEAVVISEQTHQQGSELRLTVDGVLTRKAAIAGREDARHSLTFHQPLSIAELAEVALALQPFAPVSRHGLPARSAA